MNLLTLATGAYLLVMIPVTIVFCANVPPREKRRIDHPIMNHLLSDICSGYPEQVWSAACQIIRFGQNPEKIRMLFPYISLIERKTAKLKMGGSSSSNQMFIDFALLTIRFHWEGGRCPCGLFSLEYVFRSVKTKYYYFEPIELYNRGYIDILKISFTAHSHIDYIVRCRNCGQQFKVEERIDRSSWWRWEKIYPDN